MARNAGAPAEPSISWSGGATTEGAILYRDGDGAVVAVAVAYMPEAGRPAHCSLTVGDDTVKDSAVFGAPAMCVWVDGVTWDGAPNEPRATLR